MKCTYVVIHSHESHEKEKHIHIFVFIKFISKGFVVSHKIVFKTCLSLF